ncbi:hypothetical protein C2G38_2239297 [Gigaspora rosea]|uniref:Uncharacterized protein n=1 Tax=Gigaspora rosea TaxID=44941 RepID=A0A397WAR4_9GLOM|nr:hypothetical protein C2G38_2239297 [Gigaspora rosea]
MKIFSSEVWVTPLVTIQMSLRSMGHERGSTFYAQKSAEMVHTTGMVNVGSYYSEIGDEKDERKAFTYFQKSTEIGNAGE